MKALTALLLAVLIIACTTVQEPIETPQAPTTQQSPAADALMAPKSNSTAEGTVHVTQLADGSLSVVVEMTGVTPGPHGLHVHEKGDCTAANASTAGGHYNPENVTHGGPETEAHHAGDLGNVDASADGTIYAQLTVNGMSLEGENSIVGRSFVLHNAQDDLATQPAGNSGARIACGVIIAAK